MRSSPMNPLKTGEEGDECKGSWFGRTFVEGESFQFAASALPLTSRDRGSVLIRKKATLVMESDATGQCLNALGKCDALGNARIESLVNTVANPPSFSLLTRSFSLRFATNEQDTRSRPIRPSSQPLFRFFSYNFSTSTVPNPRRPKRPMRAHICTTRPFSTSHNETARCADGSRLCDLLKHIVRHEVNMRSMRWSLTTYSASRDIRA